MAVCRAHYNIYAWIIAVAMCVSYLGVCGLYNQNVRNYSVHSISSLGESRGIDAGNNDVLIVDSCGDRDPDKKYPHRKFGGIHRRHMGAVGSPCGVAVKSDILCVCIDWQIHGGRKQPKVDAAEIYTQKRRKKTSGICR